MQLKQSQAPRNEPAWTPRSKQAELERLLTGQEQLDQSASKARSLIFSQRCNETVRSRIEERSQHKRTTEDNPIEPLNNVKVLTDKALLDQSQGCSRPRWPTCLPERDAFHVAANFQIQSVKRELFLTMSRQFFTKNALDRTCVA